MRQYGLGKFFLTICPDSDYRPFVCTFVGSLHLKNNLPPSPVMARVLYNCLSFRKDGLSGLCLKVSFNVKLAFGRKGHMQAMGLHGVLESPDNKSICNTKFITSVGNLFPIFVFCIPDEKIWVLLCNGN